MRLTVTKFELAPRQIRAIENWLEATWSEEVMSEMCEEDACCASPLTFEFRPSGIGNRVIVRCGNKELDVSIDDDNEMPGATKFDRPKI